MKEIGLIPNASPTMTGVIIDTRRPKVTIDAVSSATVLAMMLQKTSPPIRELERYRYWGSRIQSGFPVTRSHADSSVPRQDLQARPPAGIPRPPNEAPDTSTSQNAASGG